MLKRLILSLPFLAFFAASGLACQYTVRDVGFVDLQPRAYSLYILPDAETLPLWTEFREGAGTAFFADSNIRLEVVGEAEFKTHADLAGLADRIDSLPRAILMAEDGRPLILDNPIRSGAAQAEILAFLEGFLDSPVRKEITRHLIRSHCVTLLVEGATDEANRSLTEGIDRIHDALAKRLDRLDKPAKEGPKLVRLPRERRDSEKILLWSLGIEERDGAAASVAVLFGKGRAIGGAMTGTKADLAEIEKRVGLIGESCECELDRSWMQGESIPLRWNMEMQTEVARTLGFDAENPMVKMEIAQILDKGSGTGPAVESFAYSEDPLFGYGEMEVVDFGGEASTEESDSEVLVTRVESNQADLEPTVAAEPVPAPTPGSATRESVAPGPLAPTRPVAETAGGLGENTEEFQAPSAGSRGLIVATLFFAGVLAVGLTLLLRPRFGGRMRVE